MEYTRAEAIEEQKADIDARIEHYRTMREMYSINSASYDMWDMRIDTLLAEKDAITEGEFVAEIGDPRTSIERAIEVMQNESCEYEDDLYDWARGG